MFFVISLIIVFISAVLAVFVVAKSFASRPRREQSLPLVSEERSYVGPPLRDEDVHPFSSHRKDEREQSATDLKKKDKLRKRQERAALKNKESHARQSRPMIPPREVRVGGENPHGLTSSRREQRIGRSSLREESSRSTCDNSPFDPMSAAAAAIFFSTQNDDSHCRQTESDDVGNKSGGDSHQTTCEENDRIGSYSSGGCDSSSPSFDSGSSSFDSGSSCDSGGGGGSD